MSRRTLPFLLLIVVAFSGCGEQTPRDRALDNAQVQYERCLKAMDEQQDIALINVECDVER